MKVTHFVVALVFVTFSASAKAEPSKKPDAAVPAAPAAKIGYDDTPMQPNGKWRVHDGSRPAPVLVTPGTFSSAKTPGKPPSDAIVLLGSNKADLSKWTALDGTPVTWKFKQGVLEAGKGFIRTKEEFGDVQLHMEWASPKVIEGEGQKRGNSGVFFAKEFEIQILDSWKNPTYPDGQAGAIYGQYPPLVNASKKPGEWQVYDIVFVAPRFKADGKLDKPAVITVFHNGVVVHHGTAYWGPSAHKKVGEYRPELAKGPIVLQDHKDAVRFRNIWVRPLKGYDEP